MPYWANVPKGAIDGPDLAGWGQKMTADLIHIPEEAPFTPEQRSWLNGFLKKAMGGEVEKAKEESYSKSRPFSSRILHNENLNAEGSGKETRHIALSLEGSGLEYEVGDALGVVPQNPSEVVDELIAALSFDAAAEVSLPDGGKGTLREALISSYDIRNLASKFLAAWSDRSESVELKALVEAGEKEAMTNFAWGRELIDLVVEHPAEFADAEEFVSVLKKLQPRLYSIASSPKAHPGEVHLTIGVVRYDSHGRARGGVCSTFLADRASDLTAGVYVHSNKAFRPPVDDSTPLIMVGPGTGIAPFRSFLEERQATGAKGKNWLFFGNPHAATDYLYEEQLGEMVESGVLSRLDTAFSRDQEHKVYVQDRMIECGAELWRWLEEGAAFCVCGDAARMAKDVDAALHEVVERHGGLSGEEAAGYVKVLRKEKRYCRDVY
ncbi:MAG: sulfite reductase subunit alpha [Akkermansiaceae bacterium]|nr:sulfite reductase subunit alpha [Akkermansiaceae bacterium]